ncbi:uncharacterized protein LOC126664735 [Mercurialis annua]|uniref:uncharacterized protein LOC126664735 n=1 Tax=Mercurialis annua TaxID=3986 RepID=UPI0021609944|nr:uncharacterized protein LOC126664735 [Mercurialis annua]
MMGTMDYMMEKNLFFKAKSIFSSLYGIILWSTTLPSSSSPPSAGLKTLIYPPDLIHHPFVIHSYKKSLTPSLPVSPSLSTTSSSSSSSSLFQSLNISSSRSSWSSSMLDDLIGAESGVYLKSSEEEGTARMVKLDEDKLLRVNQGKRNEQQCEIMKRNRYPPAIPSLARKGNLPPCILTRYYSDGRLILKEEKLQHREYFESYRENGHLILKLVHLDEVDDDEEEAAAPELHDHEELIEEEEETDMYEKLSSSLPKSYLKNGSERHGDLRKCFTYSGKMISDSYISCYANAGYEYMNQPGSATNSPFNVHQMTTVA